MKMVCRSVGRSTTRRQWNFVDQTKRAQTVETYDAQWCLAVRQDNAHSAHSHTHTHAGKFFLNYYFITSRWHCLVVRFISVSRLAAAPLCVQCMRCRSAFKMCFTGARVARRLYATHINRMVVQGGTSKQHIFIVSRPVRCLWFFVWRVVYATRPQTPRTHTVAGVHSILLCRCQKIYRRISVPLAPRCSEIRAACSVFAFVGTRECTGATIFLAKT